MFGIEDSHNWDEVYKLDGLLVKANRLTEELGEALLDVMVSEQLGIDDLPVSAACAIKKYLDVRNVSLAKTPDQKEDAKEIAKLNELVRTLTDKEKK